MKKRALAILSICIMSLSGCAGVIDLNGRSDDLIAEYAAGVLMKYTYENLKPKPFDRSAYYPNGTPTAEDMKENEDGESQEENSTLYNTVSEYASMMGIGCDLNYIGYEIADTFPNAGVEAFYSVTASKGTKLVIVHFELANNTQAPIQVNTLLAQKEHKLTINADKKVNVQDTILPEDIQNMSEEIQPNEKVERVLIFQVSQEAVSDIKSLMLTVEDENGTSLLLNLKE